MEKSQIYNLGLVLGLRQTKVKTLKDSPTFLDDVITAWLRKEDQVAEKGEPSWRVLVNALKHHRVGQTGIANKIAEGMYCQQLLVISGHSNITNPMTISQSIAPLTTLPNVVNRKTTD